MDDWDGILARDVYEFKDRGIVIAGGASGIGAALADGFHWLGARVIILDKIRDQAESLSAALVQKRPGKDFHTPIVIAADLAAEKDRNRAVADCRETGSIGSFISTLGYDRRVDFAGHTQDDMEQLLRVNFIAPIMLARDLIPSIRESGGGALCLFTSHHGSDLFETNVMGYGAAKAALDNGIMRLAKFAGEDNTTENMVRVFGLRPGWVQTPNQTSRFDRDAFEGAVREQLLPIGMVAADLVPFVIGLLSARHARLLSGTIIDYDAGGGQISRASLNAGETFTDES